MYSYIDGGKEMECTVISDSPSFFWGPPAGACARNLYQALSTPQFKVPGYEATKQHGHVGRGDAIQ